MGQAKLRGTLEQRIEQAKELIRQAEARERERLANAPPPAKPTKATLVAAGLVAAASSLGFNPLGFNPYPIVRRANRRVWK